MFEKSKTLDIAKTSDALASEFYNKGLYSQAILQNQITVNFLGGNTLQSLKNFAVCYAKLLDSSNALKYFQEYMRVSKSHTQEDIRELCNHLNRDSKFQESLRILENQQHDCSEKYLDLGWHYFRNNEFESAFTTTEQGRTMGNICWIGDKWNNRPNCAKWQGENIKNKKICLIGEGGLGDEIIFSRWIPDLILMGAEVDYFTTNSLQSVICDNFNIKPYDKLKSYDFWTSGMSLPVLTTRWNPEITQSYLTPDPLSVEKWAKILKSYENPIVINWTGSHTFAENVFRDIPVDYLVERLKSKGTLLSVCLGANHCPAGVVDLTKDIHHWNDTLAILSFSTSCYSSCTSVAHASGAVGTSTNVFTRVDDYFTWAGTKTNEKSLWYKDVTVRRAKPMGDWKTTIDESIK
jgi:tetratricopeptide (TPR) repeat protein